MLHFSSDRQHKKCIHCSKQENLARLIKLYKLSHKSDNMHLIVISKVSNVYNNVNNNHMEELSLVYDITVKELDENQASDSVCQLIVRRDSTYQ